MVRRQPPGTMTRKGAQFCNEPSLHSLSSRLQKCFSIAQRELVTLGIIANTILNRRATGRSVSRGSHRNANPRTNKQTIIWYLRTNI